jgi:hypothetical protein
MRPRFAVLASVLTTLVAVAAPSVASAHPLHNRGLTIAATPNPINSGDGVLIYGRLKGSAASGKTIYLYHHLAGIPGFTLIGHTTTNSFGFYDFTREEGVVLTNRSWFVRGPDSTHSRTIHESVDALVSLTSDTTVTSTGVPVHFSGTVSPAIHRFQRVVLREQVGLNGNTFKTIDTAHTNGAGAFTITHRWVLEGQHTVEAVFPGDARNARGESDTITVSVEQKQRAGFTIHTSAPIIPDGQSVNISGVLDMSGGTTPEPSTSVTLYGHPFGVHPFRAIATTDTAADGGYSFTQSPIDNEVYRVRTTLAPHRATALLYQGVQDVVTLTASPSTATVGGPVTFSGNVTPDKAGHLIYLQRKDAAGNWDIVGVGLIKTDSTYSFTRVFGHAGAKQFRTRIFGGPDNVGGASAPATVTVSGVAPVSSLPPAS